jgi:hypothetical protein
MPRGQGCRHGVLPRYDAYASQGQRLIHFRAGTRVVFDAA